MPRKRKKATKRKQQGPNLPYENLLPVWAESVQLADDFLRTLNHPANQPIFDEWWDPFFSAMPLISERLKATDWTQVSSLHLMTIVLVHVAIEAGVKRCLPTTLLPSGVTPPEPLRRALPMLYFLGLLALGHRLADEGRREHPLLKAARVPAIERVVEEAMASRPPGSRAAIRAAVFRLAGFYAQAECTRRTGKQIGRFVGPLLFLRDLANFGRRGSLHVREGVEIGLKAIRKMTWKKIPGGVKDWIVREDGTKSVPTAKEGSPQLDRIGRKGSTKEVEPPKEVSPFEVIKHAVDRQTIETASTRWRNLNALEGCVAIMDGKLNIITQAIADDLKDQARHAWKGEEVVVRFEDLKPKADGPDTEGTEEATIHVEEVAGAQSPEESLDTDRTINELLSQFVAEHPGHEDGIRILLSPKRLPELAKERGITVGAVKKRRERAKNDLKVWTEKRLIV